MIQVLLALSLLIHLAKSVYTLIMQRSLSHEQSVLRLKAKQIQTPYEFNLMHNLKMDLATTRLIGKLVTVFLILKMILKPHLVLITTLEFIMTQPTIRHISKNLVQVISHFKLITYNLKILAAKHISAVQLV